MTLGQRIQKGRKEAGLSQEELAEQLGVSRQAVSRWENDNGYPEMEKIIRLSQIYQVSLDYLVGNEQEKPGEDISEKGWYVSNELAESFLAHQKSKFIKIGICFLLACVSSVFSYMNMYKLQSIHLFPVLHLLTHTIYTANLLEQSNRNLAKTEILLRIQMRLLISLSYTFSYFPQMSLLIVSTLRHQRPMVLSKSFYMDCLI